MWRGRMNCRCPVFSELDLPLCCPPELPTASRWCSHSFPPSFSNNPASDAPSPTGRRGEICIQCSLFQRRSGPGVEHSASIWRRCCLGADPGASRSQHGPLDGTEQSIIYLPEHTKAKKKKKSHTCTLKLGRNKTKSNAFVRWIKMFDIYCIFECPVWSKRNMSHQPMPTNCRNHNFWSSFGCCFQSGSH